MIPCNNISGVISVWLLPKKIQYFVVKLFNFLARWCLFGARQLLLQKKVSSQHCALQRESIDQLLPWEKTPKSLKHQQTSQHRCIHGISAVYIILHKKWDSKVFVQISVDTQRAGCFSFNILIWNKKWKSLMNNTSSWINKRVSLSQKISHQSHRLKTSTEHRKHTDSQQRSNI